jgi:hypothetical protein
MRTKKKTPTTLFGKMIAHNPEAHKLSVALNMSGISIDIPTSDIVLRVFEKMSVMGGKFDLHTACEIRANVESEYQQLIENHSKKK